MNPSPRALTKVATEVRDIASYAFGVPVSASVAMEVKAYNFRHSGVQKPYTQYKLWVLGKDDVGTFEGSWEEMLGLVEWLKDVEVTTTATFRDKGRRKYQK